jgi:hypothetical protein
MTGPAAAAPPHPAQMMAGTWSIVPIPYCWAGFPAMSTAIR